MRKVVENIILTYDRSMRVTISLPKDLHRSADALAEELGIPRSQLYCRALTEFVAKWRSSDITARLNAVYGDEAASLEPAIVKAQARSVRNNQ